MAWTHRKHIIHWCNEHKNTINIILLAYPFWIHTFHKHDLLACGTIFISPWRWLQEVAIYKRTRRHILQDRSLHIRRRENPSRLHKIHSGNLLYYIIICLPKLRTIKNTSALWPLVSACETDYASRTCNTHAFNTHT
jgi:hypothetical protein